MKTRPLITYLVLVHNLPVFCLPIKQSDPDFVALKNNKFNKYVLICNKQIERKSVSPAEITT